MATEARPVKRIHQACDNCRRKKTRCPGERPACSTCQMLSQDCVYITDIAEADRYHERTKELERGLQGVEAKLDMVLDRLVSAATPPCPAPIAADKSGTAFSPTARSDTSVANPTINLELQEPQVQNVADTFLFYFDGQPLPLFQRSSLLESIRRPGSETLFSIMALCHGRWRRCDFPEPILPAETYIAAARQLIANKMLRGTIDLTALQASALVGLYELNTGLPRRAKLTLSMASRLALVAADIPIGQSTEPILEAIEDRCRCFWSLYLLETMSGMHPGVLTDARADETPRLPRSAGPQSGNRLISPLVGHPSTAFDGRRVDAGIVAYFIQLSQTWVKVAKYVERSMDRRLSDSPPWSLDSEYAEINACLLKFESTFILPHRFDQPKFSERSLTDLNNNRAYWNPFLYIQFQYHVIRCLLDHPFICSYRLLKLSPSIPTSFLQASSDAAMLHSNWIVRFIDMIQNSAYQLFDPFFAYCAAVSATIHLHNCNVQDETLKQNARLGASKCLKFVDALAQEWPIVQEMAQNLRNLSMSASDWASFHHGSPSITKSPVEYSTILWKLLSYHSDRFVPLAREKIFHESQVPIDNTMTHTEESASSTNLPATQEEDQNSPVLEMGNPEASEYSNPFTQTLSMNQFLGTGHAEGASPFGFTSFSRNAMLYQNNQGGTSHSHVDRDGDAEIMTDWQAFENPQFGKALQDWWNLGTL